MSKFLVGNIKGPKGDKGETGAVGPKGEQGIQGPVGPAGGVTSVNGMTGDVEVDGRNLVLNSGTTVSNSTHWIHEYNLSEKIERNTVYTIRLWGNIHEGLRVILYVGGESHGFPKLLKLQEGVYGITASVQNVTDEELNAKTVRVYVSSDGYESIINYIKIERGIVTNPVWTPSPQDVLLKGEVDGRNLILNSNAEKKNSLYQIASYGTSVNKLEKNVPYTATLCVTPAEHVERFDLYYHLGHIKICDFPMNGTNKQIVSNTFTYLESMEEEVYAEFSPDIYRIPNNGNVTGESIIHWIKLEKGTTATDWTPAPEDVVTKIPYDIFTALDSIPEMHRNLYGGRNLGESTQMSEAHKKAIQDGSFKDLWVGDYWTHGGINWRIADVDYFYNCGDTPFTTHHLVIIPDRNLYNASMNAENSTATGYVESDMRTKNLEQAKIKINEAFPEMVLSYRDILCNTAVSGEPSKGEWVNSEIELMNEIMVFGSYILTPKNDGTSIPYIFTIGNSQLALFRLNSKFIKTRESYWLRDIASTDKFILVSIQGDVNCNISSVTYGVRPYFCIGVQTTGDEESDDMEVVSPMQEGDYMEEELE